MSWKPPKPVRGPSEPEALTKATQAVVRSAMNRTEDPQKLVDATKNWKAESARARELGFTAYTKKNVGKINSYMGGKTRRNKTTGGDIVTQLLTIRNQVKLYHWQTGSFARHKATDDLTAALDLNIDTFVESYMGRYGRPKVSGSIKLHNFSESAARSFVAKQTKYLSTVLPRKIKSTDTDLLNLRDTILGDINKVLYLFTLA